MTSTFSVDDVDREWQPTLSSARITMNSELALQVEDLERQLADTRARERGQESVASDVPTLVDRILELNNQVKATEREFVFKGLARTEFRALIRAHPPTEEQLREAADVGAGLQWNTETFQPALFAASCVQPTGSTVEWWTAKYDTWTTGQLTRLWEACIAAQAGVTETPKALLASSLNRKSEPK